jgi:ABC-type phosphate transport system substrate-binding protein
MSKLLRRRRSRIAFGLAVLAAGGWGCNSILGFDDFKVSTLSPEGGSAEGGPVDSGADGCVPGHDKLSLENACSTATCVPFDNKRLTACSTDGGGVTCPAAPVSDAGIPAPLQIPDGGWDGGSLPSCSNLPATADGKTFPKPYIFGAGSSALSLYVGKIAQTFENESKGTILYQIAGSCYGSYTTVLGYKLAQVPASTGNGTATYFDPVKSDTNGVPVQYTCVIDDDTREADFGVSDVFATTCLPQLKVNGGLPSNLHDFFGPVQTMVLATPTGSTQSSVSAEAAYMVWGFGQGSGVNPWTVEAQLLQRSGSSGTQSMMSAAIGLDPFSWKGKPHKANQDVLTDILAAGGAAEQTLGILAADFVEDNRSQIKTLAIQDRGQTCGYYPDSSLTAHDKQNVRDGHYPVWGPSHFLVPVNGNQQPTNDTVKAFVDALSGTVALPGLDLLQTYVQRHVVPICAMHVTRNDDGQEYAPYTPPISCSCYFDFLAAGKAPPECVSCKVQSDCASAPDGRTSCNLFGNPAVGYCEKPGP